MNNYQKLYQLAVLGFVGVLIFEIIPLRPLQPPPERWDAPATVTVPWNGHGAHLVATGTIDEKKFEALYAKRGGLDADTKRILSDPNAATMIITEDNASVMLNMLWAFGLGNKNEILTDGEMADPRYGGAGKFASTGGWTLAAGEPMSHYSKHAWVVLSADQQNLVDRVSRGIYRPCCNNSTHFPDCNHGMAMLGLLQLMAAQGASERELYTAALAVNKLWFPGTYDTIGAFLKKKGVDPRTVAPDKLLGAAFSSSSGYKAILAEVEPSTRGKGGGCGV